MSKTRVNELCQLYSLKVNQRKESKFNSFLSPEVMYIARYINLSRDFIQGNLKFYLNWGKIYQMWK